jgi:hypothetical protein
MRTSRNSYFHERIIIPGRSLARPRSQGSPPVARLIAHHRSRATTATMSSIFPSQVVNYGAGSQPLRERDANLEHEQGEQRPAKRRNTGGIESFDDLVGRPPPSPDHGGPIAPDELARSGAPSIAPPQVADAGVVNWGSEEGEYLEVHDPRALRRHLELKLVANADLRARFLAGLEEALQQHDVLRRALMPLAVLSASAYATGDSFLRIVLNIPCLQVMAPP